MTRNVPSENMIQSFRKIKIDPNDKFYSEIIRFGLDRCQRCDCHRSLACCHIMGRSYKGTRWMIKPVRNAIALCADCHSWFDSCKDDTPIFNEKSRPFFLPEKNAYSFLVQRCYYKWDDLHNLYALAHRSTIKYGSIEKNEIKKQLKEYLASIKKGKINEI